MKVFVSWSGGLSQKVACAFREWIPCVLQYVKPYVSSEDIDKGNRWSTDIAVELNDSTYGILCVTADNQAAPWLNFEAGALSKAIEKSFVTPFLLNLKPAELKNGPLIQFQATTFSGDEVRKLVESINAKAETGERVEQQTVKKTFDKWWPELEKDLQRILAEVPPEKGKVSSVPSKQDAMLEQLLDLARSQQRQLADPENLLPPPYLEWALNKTRLGVGRSHLNRDSPMHRMIIRLVDVLEEMEDSDQKQKALELANDLHSEFHRERPPYPTTPKLPLKEIQASVKPRKKS